MSTSQELMQKTRRKHVSLSVENEHQKLEKTKAMKDSEDVEEKWLPCGDFPSYSVSNLGRIRYDVDGNIRKINNSPYPSIAINGKNAMYMFLWLKLS